MPVAAACLPWRLPTHPQAYAGPCLAAAAVPPQHWGGHQAGCGPDACPSSAVPGWHGSRGPCRRPGISTSLQRMADQADCSAVVFSALEFYCLTLGNPLPHKGPGSAVVASSCLLGDRPAEVRADHSQNMQTAPLPHKLNIPKAHSHLRSENLLREGDFIVGCLRLGGDVTHLTRRPLRTSEPPASAELAPSQPSNW